MGGIMNTENAVMDRLAGLLGDGGGDARADATIREALLSLIPDEPPSDQQVAAFYDGVLSEDDAAQVRLALLRDPARLEDYLAFADAMAALETPALQAPVLKAPMDLTAANQPMLRRIAPALGAVAALLLCSPIGAIAQVTPEEAIGWHLFFDKNLSGPE